MKLRLHSVLACLLLAAAAGKSQDLAAPQTPEPPAPDAQASPSAPAAQQPSATLRAPVEVPSNVNNGHGLSLDVVYWFGRSRPVLRGGDAYPYSSTGSGNFNYITNPNATVASASPISP